MENVAKEHKKEYEKKPEVVASAPGRFHLIGEHTWFFKDKTLSMAVDLPVHVAVSRRKDTNLRFFYPQLGEKKRAGLASLKYKKEDKWANAVKAVLYGFQSGGFDCEGMNVTVYSDILPSAGFGITTAIKVASAWAVRELMAFRLDDRQMLQVIERANRLFLQCEDFRADNFAAIYSKPHSLVLTDHARAGFDVIPFPFEERTVILTDARVPRIVTWNEESLLQPENVLLLGELKERRSNIYGGWHYEDRASEVNEVLSVVGEDTRRRLMCIMGEHRSVLEAEAAVHKNDFSAFARAVNRSHENMRSGYDLSCPEIDWILKRVQELGDAPDDLRAPVSCGRITGKGFGRSVYTILRTSDVEKYRERLSEYERIFGFHPECHVVRPAGGVTLL